MWGFGEVYARWYRPVQLTRAQMLALVLYTGCDCNYDLCAAERGGDFTKWKWFSKLLDEAIVILWRRRDDRDGKFRRLLANPKISREHR